MFSSRSLDLDHTKTSRRGPEPLPLPALRTHVVSVRVNAAELAALDGQRAQVQMQRGEYLRCSSLHRLPPTIPSLNIEAWGSLARASGNLNVLVRKLHEAALGLESGAPDPSEIAEALADFRRALVGAQRPDEGAA